jgi:preprotein translocase subunit SecY
MSSDLGPRIAITIGALLVFQFGTYVSIPGIDSAVWEQIFRQHSDGILGALNTLAGGAIGRMSIFALGTCRSMAA